MLSFFCFILLTCWAVGHLVKKLDGDGSVRSVAKQGIINVISRWMK
jgi:hypothetical protein